MKQYVKTIGQFVSEELRYSEEEKHTIASELQDLHDLVELNLIPKETLDAKRKQIISKAGDKDAVWKDPVLGPLIASDIYRALKSESFERLKEIGYEVKSTYRQVLAGSVSIAPPTAKLALNVDLGGKLTRPGSGTSAVMYASPMEGERGIEDAFAWIHSNVDHSDPKLRKKTTVQRERVVIAKNSPKLAMAAEAFSRLGFDDSETEELLGYARVWPKSSEEFNHYNYFVDRFAKIGVVTVFGFHYDASLSPSLEKKIHDLGLKWTFYGGTKYVVIGPSRGRKTDFTYSILPSFVLSSEDEESLSMYRTDTKINRSALVEPAFPCSVTFQNMDLKPEHFDFARNSELGLTVVLKNCDLPFDLTCRGVSNIGEMTGTGNVNTDLTMSNYMENHLNVVVFPKEGRNTWTGTYRANVKPGTVANVATSADMSKKLKLNGRTVNGIATVANMGMSKSATKTDLYIAFDVDPTTFDAKNHFGGIFYTTDVAFVNGGQISKKTYHSTR